MSKLLERPLTIGCYLAVLFIPLTAWGQSWECQRLELEIKTPRAALQSGAADRTEHRGSMTSGFNSDRPSFHLDILDDECDEDSEFKFVAGQTLELALAPPRAVSLSDADHTTLARGRWARLPILRC
jgi:hypothetical protein